MPRLKPTSERSINDIRLNLGKVLIICEGHTEKKYFDYFSILIKNISNKYSQIIAEYYCDENQVNCENAKGDAHRVYNFTKNFITSNNNAQIYLHYDKFMVFDCDAPSNINIVIQDMLSDSDTNSFTLIPTYLMFENWLLFHYNDINVYTKPQIEQELTNKLGCKYKKNSSTIIKTIIGNLDPVRTAITASKFLDDTYTSRGLNYINNITQMNPFSMMHRLMGRILDQL
jgi:hypothetical protein